MSSAYHNEGKYASTSACSMLNKQAKIAKYCKQMLQCMHYPHHARVYWKINFRLEMTHTHKRTDTHRSTHTMVSILQLLPLT